MKENGNGSGYFTSGIRKFSMMRGLPSKLLHTYNNQTACLKLKLNLHSTYIDSQAHSIDGIAAIVNFPFLHNVLQPSSTSP